MTAQQLRFLLVLCVTIFMLNDHVVVVSAFSIPVATATSAVCTSSICPTHVMTMTPMTTTMVMAAAGTIDPTAFLSNIFSAMIQSDIILAVPIVVALACAFLIAYGIVAYANPQVEDDE